MSDLQRTRMSEMFVTMRDALERAMVPVYQLALDSIPRRERPPYLPAAEPKSQSVAEYQAALRKLGALGIVRSN